MCKTESVRGISIGILLLLLISCAHDTCPDASVGAYSGKDFIIVSYPASGPVYDAVFFPVCVIDTAHFMNSLNKNSAKGIEFGIMGPGYKRAIRKFSCGISARNSKGRIDSLHIAPVYIKYHDAHDYTYGSTGQRELKMEYNINQKKFDNKLFYAGRVEIDSLVFLKYQP